MTPAARVAAAIDILADLDIRRRPVNDALREWGQTHRFAGSKDRAAVATLVYDALRRRASAACLLGEDTPRAVVLGMLRLGRGLEADDIARLFSGERFAPAALSADERARLAAPVPDMPAFAAGDFPEWVEESLLRALGDELIVETQALADRAPIDIRVNTLKTSREALAQTLAHLSPEPTPHAPDGLRFHVDADGRGPALQAEPEFLHGLFEIQDEGSQLASRLTLAAAGEQVIDLCAGAGGKTLALAAQMDNRGQIYATDIDAQRLTAIHARLERSGARNVQLRVPRGRFDPVRRPEVADPLADLAAGADLVLVDAPCTGTGTWRRNPDAKWRLRPGALRERVADQAIVLDRAAGLVKSGGRIAYITCSLLPEENDDAIAAFLMRHDDFSILSSEEVCRQAGVSELASCATTGGGLLLTPHRTGTDGFYVAVLRKGASG
ncbi:MAG: RsmB/NOP family class I SAM-dependent RNA methyltransferase [Pseudochelatococcus sp.]|jgi:16S rRNA (cytosine967-C5)-methyltransferase|uniref:RsmB/NOP family class I SAM-dependent RNA methyltransferase n=1 Tax=Pseudochelatococcus sp. TaxID=2020869 RepID=UPI003D8E1F4A